MSDGTQINFDPPKSKAEQRAEKGGAPAKPKPTTKERIARLPQMARIDPATIGSADQRSIAASKMRLAGAPFHEIAAELGYQSAEQARAAYIAALASMNPMEDLETLRQSAALRAEMLFAQSFAMASADYLVVTETDEETGEEVEIRVSNPDRHRWHEQAAKDLALHTMITGAKAPAKIEMSATVEQLNKMVHTLVATSGQQSADIEADIWDLKEIEAINAEIVED